MSEWKLAVRRLRRRPGRAAAGVLALALGIGASTAAFSAVQQVLLAPLPVTDQDELVVLWHRSAENAFEHVPFSADQFEAVRGATSVMTEVAAMETLGAWPTAAEGSDGPFVLNRVRVAGDFFGVLGATPAAGRLLRASDDQVGAAPVAVVSHGYWTRTAGRDPALIGSTLRYDERTYTVVGVAPEGFEVPRGAEVWATLRGTFPDWAEEVPIGIELDLVGRLGPGRSASDAAAEVAAVIGDAPDLVPYWGRVDAVAVSLHEQVFGALEPVLEAVLVAALVLLAAAVANATLLLLSAGARLVREMAVRRALGAQPLRILAAPLADAALHAALGAGLGVLLAWMAIDGLLPLAPVELPRLDEVRLEAGAVAFAVLLGAVTMIVSGGLAGLIAGRVGPRIALQGSAGSAGQGGEGARRVIAGSQMALAVVAAAGAALLMRSVSNLSGIDRGFDAEGLYVVHLTHGYAPFEVPPEYVPTLERAVDELEARPGVVAATPTLNPPLSRSGGLDMIPRLEGETPEQARQNPFVSLDAVFPAYFGTVGTRVIEGRGLGPEDGPGGAPAVVVNESAARSLWPGESAIGKRMVVAPGSPDLLWTVVGVVEDSRYRSFPEARPAAYLPLSRYQAIAPSRLLVRTDGAAGPVGDLVRSALTAAAPGVRVLSVDAMEDVMRGPTARPRFAAAVLMAFALVTVVLALLGVYGVFTVMVQERAAELGVRRALGASSRHVVTFVARRVLVVGVVGAAVGGTVSVFAGRLLESLLFGVTPGDPLTLAAVLSMTLLGGLAAAGLPALRATRADPVAVLRAD